ncbi:MAG TPA: hypothetical protein PK867_06320 [Pirellulales bacterium]|nr:hypothetical protein [Pirellulales bacterium]
MAGGLLVNNLAVTTAAHLRSGDVVRLSSEGPEFSFNLLARCAPAPQHPASTAPISSVAPAHASPFPQFLGAQAARPILVQRPVADDEESDTRCGMQPRGAKPSSLPRKLFAAVASLAVIAAAFVVASRLSRVESNGRSAGDESNSTRATKDRGVATEGAEAVDGPRAKAPGKSEFVRLDPKAAAGASDGAAILQQYEPAILWIGFELKGYQFVHASGWAVARNKVATTAKAAVFLRAIVAESQAAGQEVALVVRCGAGETFRVREIEIHPSYDPLDPLGRESLPFGVAVAHIQGELAALCAIEGDAGRDALREKPAFVATGYTNAAGAEPFDPVKRAVHLGPSAVEIVATDPPAGGPHACYIVKVAGHRKLPGELLALDGAPVWNEKRRVVGVLLATDDKIRLIPVMMLRHWLED